MRLIIDTDAGVDDAQAIMMALYQPGVVIEAITTLTGNVHRDKVNRNVLTILALTGRDIPVYAGAIQPLVPGFWQAEERIHGGDGLGNYTQRPQLRHTIEAAPAAVELVRRVNEAPGELTLVTLGPLTNVALACRLDPEFPHKVKQLVCMGGTINAIGNTPMISAEFNFFCDPEAALIVFDAFPMSTMVSWETTLKHPFSWKQYDTLVARNSLFGRFMRDTSRPTADFLRQFGDGRTGYLLPDPLAMAVALDPGLIMRSEQHYVSVEVQGRLTRGQCVIDYLGQTQHDPNVNIVLDLAIDGVYAMYEQMARGDRS